VHRNTVLVPAPVTTANADGTCALNGPSWSVRPSDSEVRRQSRHVDVEREHALSNVAHGYARALEVAAGGDAVNDAVLLRIAEAAAEVGIDDASALARAARESGILA